MANYFRITAYHPTENLSVIMDSNGLFEKLWQFSSFMVSKGFKIIEVGGEDKFNEGDMPKAEQEKYCNAMVTTISNLMTTYYTMSIKFGCHMREKQ